MLVTPPHRTFLFLVALGVALVCVSPIHAADQNLTNYYYRLDESKAPVYSRTHKHLAHANPKAPKGGYLRFPLLEKVPTLHPFPLDGEDPISTVAIDLVTDSLMRSPKDDPLVQYGLVAESVATPKDISWVLFTIRRDAKWHDGTNITARDVVFSFTLLKERGSSYGYRYSDYYQDVLRAEAIADNVIKFYFTKPHVKELPWIVGEMPLFSEHFWKSRAQTTKLLSPSDFGGVSGPYRIAQFDRASHASITLERVEEYWGKNHFLNRGRYNFTQITLKFYDTMKDSLEDFRMQGHDFRNETITHNWITLSTSPEARVGMVSLEELPSSKSEGMQGYIFNLHNPILQDKTLREAIILAFDFEFLNATVFHGKYKRTQSFFSNSIEFDTSHPPSREEQNLLKSLPEPIPKELLSFVYKAPRTDGSGDNTRNLMDAARLLNRSKYSYREGQLYTPDNQPIRLEILIRAGRGLDYPTLIFAQNLERLGIMADISALPLGEFTAKKATRSFDLAAIVIGQSASPGVEQRELWGSRYAYAKEDGRKNPIGINDKNVDALIERVATAQSRTELRTAVKALDRTLLWGNYVVPHWHSGTERIAYWNKFNHVPSRCRCGNDLFSWWEDSEKLQALDRWRQMRINDYK